MTTTMAWPRAMNTFCEAARQTLNWLKGVKKFAVSVEKAVKSTTVAMMALASERRKKSRQDAEGRDRRPLELRFSLPAHRGTIMTNRPVGDKPRG